MLNQTRTRLQWYLGNLYDAYRAGRRLVPDIERDMEAQIKRARTELKNQSNIYSNQGLFDESIREIKIAMTGLGSMIQLNAVRKRWESDSTKLEYTLYLHGRIISDLDKIINPKN